MPTLEARGVELSWTERGEGSPVLLIHETATGAIAWEQVSRAVDGGARAISYDRRGWGKSTAPQGYRRTTIEEQSEDAATLLEAAGAAPGLVCGAGIGAVIALDLLLRRPEVVTGAVLIEPLLLALLPEATEALSDDRAALQDAVNERGAEGAVETYLSGSLTALGAGVERLPTELTRDARDRPAILFAELGAPAGWNMPFPELAAASRPSAIVTARSTPPLLREAARALAPRLAGSEERELDSPRSVPHIGDPDGVAALALARAAA
jgi:pimeloyl-ACP methyl ester carboxylesterase